MRRADREITDLVEIEAILHRAVVCRLAMCEGARPYIVPLCFGYDGSALYFHSAREGRKLDLIRANPNVCFEFDIETQVVPAAQPCAWSMRYLSVVGWGQASLIRDLEEKRRALADHYAAVHRPRDILCRSGGAPNHSDPRRDRAYERKTVEMKGSNG